MNFEEYIYTLNLKELSELLLQSSQKIDFNTNKSITMFILSVELKLKTVKCGKFFPKSMTKSI